MKGKNLFKGILFMLIRDVNRDEAKMAYIELQTNVD